MLWLYDDEQLWGLMIYTEARKRGHDVKLFRQLEQVDGAGTVFVHMHHKGKRRAKGKGIIRRLRLREDLTLVPSVELAKLFDDKKRQTRALRPYMPRTLVMGGQGGEARAIQELGLPFISKASQGAGSNKVRLIKSHAQAMEESDLVFGEGYKFEDGTKQQGYLIWQRFLPGNDYDYRVIAIGDYRMVLRRHNRKDIPFASGSKLRDNLNTEEDFTNPEVIAMLGTANRFFQQSGYPFVGIDLIKDLEGRWYITELTVSWTHKAYLDCRFITKERELTDKFGYQEFDVILDTYENGGFNA